MYFMANRSRKTDISKKNILQGLAEKGISINKLGGMLEKEGVSSLRTLQRNLSDGVMDSASIEMISIILNKSPGFIQGKEEDTQTYIDFAMDGITENSSKLFKMWLGNLPVPLFGGEMLFFPEQDPGTVQPDKIREYVYSLPDDFIISLQRYLVKLAAAQLIKHEMEKEKTGKEKPCQICETQRE